ELPLKMMVLGDFTQRPDDTPLEERKPINIDKDNFNGVMREMKLSASMNVDNTLTGYKEDQLAVNLKFESMKDFEPEQVVNQVPDLKKLLELRTALTALRGPLGNIPNFRKRLAQMMENDSDRDRLLKELGLL
ncbi:MAG: type VI secretion system contractile sheath small subunit, partial [Limisphaerales bacterium]